MRKEYETVEQQQKRIARNRARRRRKVLAKIKGDLFQLSGAAKRRIKSREKWERRRQNALKTFIAK